MINSLDRLAIRFHALARALTIALLASGCATSAVEPAEGAAAQASPLSQLSLDLSKIVGPAVNSCLSTNDLRELADLPVTEQRRRLDIALAAHPDDLIARVLRTQAETDLLDFPAVLADSEVGLASASLHPVFRRMMLDMRAEALLQAGRAPEAVLVADQALAIDGADAEALFAHAWARHHSVDGQEDSELAELDRALQIRPDQGVGYYRRANILLSQGKFERALDDLERAVRLAPGDVPAHTLYGRELLRADHPERALAHLDTAVRLAPREPWAWTWRAFADLELHRVDAATADATQAIELGAAGDELADALTARARASILRDDPQGSLRDLDRVAVVAPSRAETFVYRAELRAKMNDWPAAAMDIDRALELEPRQARGLALHAWLRARAGDAMTANSEARQAIDLAPGDLVVHIDAMATFETLEEFEPALQQANALIGLSPEDGDHWLARAWVNQALKRYADADADFTHVVDARMVPDLDAVRFERGSERYLSGDLVGAEADFRATSDVGASRAKARRYLGRTLEDRLDYAGAAREFQRSLDLEPDAGTSGSLARMQWFSGQFVTATASFREQIAQARSVPYTPLWLFIARVRASPADETAAKAELAALAPVHQPHTWIDTLVSLMLVRTDLSAALSEADAAPADKRAARRCEADFYAAELLLVHGQEAPASRLLEEARSACPPKFVEAQAVAAERRMLQTTAR